MDDMTVWPTHPRAVMEVWPSRLESKFGPRLSRSKDKGVRNKTILIACPHSVFYSKFTREGPYKKVGRPQNVSELIRQAIDGFEDVTFVPYRLVGYRLGRSFTQSSIEIEPVDGQVKHKGIHTYISVPAAEGFHSIFKDGFERLQQSIDGNISSSDTESSNETIWRIQSVI
ncbi:Hypothetical predicted protein [Mytilus galloprovincialis]|uniref:Uncharacterized protein n=1 Tax=Mytilus galloprovincialis TaxID=29158 RepID=A0A8B6E4G1_MYTGA|nr:Hypothetical predicted protein [Mytilus galloprovincialis]